MISYLDIREFGMTDRSFLVGFSIYSGLIMGLSVLNLMGFKGIYGYIVTDNEWILSP